MGRAAVLSEIHEAVRHGGRFGVALTAQAIEGPGGIGKTRAAVEYAWAHQDDYTALLFVNAEAPDALNQGLAALTRVLGQDHLDNQPDAQRASAVVDWLNGHPGWLLILDNVDTEAAAKAAGDLLGRLSGGHVLLTSRQHGLAPGAGRIALDHLDPAAAAALLLEQTQHERAVGPADQADAADLAAELRGLPLALEMAAAAIRARRCSLAEYRRLWRDRRNSLTGRHEPVIAGYHRNPVTTLLDEIEQLRTEARTLLQRLAFVAPDPVPVFLLDVPVPAGGSSVAGTRSALDELAAHALVARKRDDDDFTIPAPVQDGLRRSLDPATASQRLIEALGWIDAAFAGDPEDPRTWPVLEPLAPHAAAVAGFADAAGIVDPTNRLMSRLGLYWWVTGEFARAEPLLRRALGLDETRFGPDHPEVATGLNNLAALLQATNRLGEAEPLMRRALCISQASFGPDHPNAATALSNLAVLLQDTNRLGEAEPLMRRALAIDEASFGPDHPNVAIRLSNLAGLLQATNRLGEAEPLMRRALRIDEASFGPDHPNAATALNNLAALLQGTNRLGEAETLMRRALGIGEARLGPDHPNVATALNNLAQLLKATNRLGEAEPLMRRALGIDEASVGPDHPNVAIRLNNLATLLYETDRLGEAEPLMRRALGIDEASFGPDHPNVATDLNNLAQLLKATNRLGEAEPLMRRMVAIVLAFQRDTGHAHPHRDAAIGNYTALLRAMGRSEAEIAAAITAVANDAGVPLG
jgi:tetratricopeptide (TPR) repeat protein